MLERIKKITDICILVDNIETTVDFYTQKLGFQLRRRAEGFADFHAPGVILAAWELDHINAHTKVVPNTRARGVNKACIAVELDSPADIDALYTELLKKGVKFLAPPADYAWTARCVYFHDPDQTLWELYAWDSDGEYHDTYALKQCEQQ